MAVISIITPLYNSEKYLEKTITSIMKQHITNWELILVDDASTDNTLNMANEYSRKDSRITVIPLEENRGAAFARNTAIKHANGRFIAFLDSDDEWLPDKLAVQLDFMRSHDVAFSYTAYQRIDENNELLNIVNVPNRVNYTDLLKVCSIGCLTAMYDTEKLGKVYMPHIRKRQDLGLWLRLLKLTPYAYGINTVLGSYKVRPNSISANKFSAASYTWRLYRKHEKLNLFSASYYFMHYAFNGIARTVFPKFARLVRVLP